MFLVASSTSPFSPRGNRTWEREETDSDPSDSRSDETGSALREGMTRLVIYLFEAAHFFFKFLRLQGQLGVFLAQQLQLLLALTFTLLLARRPLTLHLHLTFLRARRKRRNENTKKGDERKSHTEMKCCAVAHCRMTRKRPVSFFLSSFPRLCPAGHLPIVHSRWPRSGAVAAAGSRGYLNCWPVATGPALVPKQPPASSITKRFDFEIRQTQQNRHRHQVCTEGRGRLRSIPNLVSRGNEETLVKQVTLAHKHHQSIAPAQVTKRIRMEVGCWLGGPKRGRRVRQNNTVVTHSSGHFLLPPPRTRQVNR